METFIYLKTDGLKNATYYEVHTQIKHWPFQDMEIEVFEEVYSEVKVDMA